MSKKDHKEPTRVIHAGYDASEYHGVVNPPITRTSTIIYDSLDAYESPDTKYRYGRYGTPLTDNFITALCELENGFNGVVAPSGLAAITTALTGFLSAGDHLLIVDTIYPPTRDFCERILKRMGVEVEYYDPAIGAGIEALVKDNTAVIYLESAGSATLEIQDVPAIVKVAKDKGIVTIMDNSWASGVLFKPMDHGVDVVVLSCTKYINGHSDIMLGAALARDEAHYKKLKLAALDLGVCAGSEEVSLGLRGLKTIHIRMKEAGERALKIAEFLEGQKGVQRVYHPALPSHPTHDLWKRDYSGCNGLVSILLEPASKDAVRKFTDALELFPIGSSWGGYESLLQPQYLKNYRTANPWEEEGAFMRFQIGFEDTDDLIADLENALKVFNAAK